MSRARTVPLFAFFRLTLGPANFLGIDSQSIGYVCQLLIISSLKTLDWSIQFFVKVEGPFPSSPFIHRLVSSMGHIKTLIGVSLLVLCSLCMFIVATDIRTERVQLLLIQHLVSLSNAPRDCYACAYHIEHDE